MAEATLHTNGVKSILEIASKWNALCDEGPCSDPFLRPEWFESLARNFGYEVELITVRNNGELRAVLPLTRKKRRIHGLPVRKLQALFNLNTPRFGLVHGPDLNDKEECLRSIWKVIKDQPKWTVFETRLVRKDSWLAGLIDIAKSESFYVGEWEMDAAPFIALPEDRSNKFDANDLLKLSGKRPTQQLDRKLRRLRDVGKVELVVKEEYSPELLDRFFELEARGWKGRHGTAVAEDPRVVTLNHDAARAASDRKGLVTHELTLDGRTIAMIVSIMSGRTMYFWKTCYDEAYSRYSPGNLLFKMFVDDCLRRDVDEIDLLSPSTANKACWATGERPHAAYYIFDRGLFGSFFWLWKVGIAARLRKLKSHPLQDMIPLLSNK